MLEEYLDKAKTAIAHPNLLGRGLNQRYFRFRNRDFSGFNRHGTKIFEKDWDNLLILDACRYDDFTDLHGLPGEVSAIQSMGARTPEFLQANFGGKYLNDVIYINANPMLHRRVEDFNFSVFELIDLWKSDWDDETGTVLPETVKEQAIVADQKYPNKRLVIHFLQPHYPFLGSEEEFDQDPKCSNVGDNLWRRLERGELQVSGNYLHHLYRKNLKQVLPCVEDLLETLRGKNVVTSDHGNMFGERSFPIPHKEWGHPPGIYTTQLVKVPWLVHTNGTRKEIQMSNEGVEVESENENIVNDRLESLGYTE